MRILLLSNLDMGLYKFRREILEALASEHEVFFSVPEGEYVSNLEETGCRFISCDYLDRRSTNPIRDMKLLKFYLRTIDEIRPDAVLTYTIKPNVYGGIACRIKKIPYIANVTGLGTTIENGGLLALLTTTLYRVGLKKTQCVFFQNKDNMKLFADKGVSKGRTRLIPGSGVNLSLNAAEPYPPEGDETRFLFVGRIMKDKGIEELLSAVTELRAENERIVLDIVGFCEEDYVKDLEEAERNGIIVSHGLQADVRPFYKNCHCVVLPSYHEGMSNVMLEASATARPVITTQIPGCRETFDEGVTGFGCEPKSTESLKTAMLSFLSLGHDEREKMGLEARKKMEREFDRQLVLDAYRDELSKIDPR